MKRRAFITRASLLSVPLLGGRVSAAGESDLASGNNSDPAGTPFLGTPDELSGGVTPVSQQYPVADVRRYGATGDGVTDDSASIQTAVNASLNVYFPAGNYLVRKKIDLRTGSSLIADGTATLRTDGTSYILSAVGKIGSRRRLRGNVKRGTIRISAASTTGSSYKSAGGYFLQSDKLPLGHAIHRSGELGVVSSVNRDEIIVSGSVLAEYLIADKAMAAPVTFVENISIRGLRLTNDTYTNDPTKVTSALIYLEFVKDFRVSECAIQKNNSAGINAFNSLNGVISNNTIGELRDGRPGILGYGVQIGYSSQNITVSGNTFSECRHAVTTGTGTKASRTPNYGVSRGLAIVGNSISNCTSAGLDTHEDSDGVTISSNTVIACRPVGIHVRSYRSSICGNTITACAGKGIRIAKTAQDTVASGNIISGIRRASSDGDGIVVDSPAVTISGNRISNCDRHGISVEANASEDISITGNSCKNNGQAAAGNGININRRGPISRLTVVGNACTDDQARKTQRFNFAIEAGTSVSQADCLVANNNFSFSAQKPFENRGSGVPATSNNLGHAAVTILPSGSATPSVSGGKLFRSLRSARITFFTDGHAGQTIQILAAGSTVIANGPRIRLVNNRDYVMSSADTLTLTMFEDQVWHEVCRSVNKQ